MNKYVYIDVFCSIRGDFGEKNQKEKQKRS